MNTKNIANLGAICAFMQYGIQMPNHYDVTVNK